MTDHSRRRTGRRTPGLPEGYTVRYRHRRMAAGDDPRFARKMNYIPPEWPGPKGGETEAKVYGPDDSVVAIGVAVCHPRDNFNRRIGRDIALGRALKQLAEKTPAVPLADIYTVTAITPPTTKRT